MKKKLMRPASCFIVGLTWIACTGTLVDGSLQGLGDNLVGGALQPAPGNCWENNQVILDYIATHKGSLPLPKRMNFRKSSKRPLTTPPHFRKIMLQIF